MRTVSNRWMMPLLTGVLAAAGCDTNDATGPGPEPTPVASVVVAPKDGVWTGMVKVGQAVELTATPKATDGSDLPATSIVWTSSDTTVAVVNAAGRVTARGIGMTAVNAAIGGRNGQITVMVIADQPSGAVATVVVSPAAATLEVGQSRQYTARAFDASGTEIQGRTVTWTTSAPTIVSVSGLGVVRALAPGYADIIATIEGKSAAVGATVSAIDPDATTATLRSVANNSLPSILRTFKVTDERGIELTRTIKVTAGSIKVDLQTRGYEQQVTQELWEDIYWVLDGQPVFCCVQLKETKVFDDRGSVAPLYEGSGTLVFRSDVIATHSFTGFRTASGYEVTQRVLNAGEPAVLRFAWQ